jgi:glycosyltransferase involved in cell wall biosynthesis
VRWIVSELFYPDEVSTALIMTEIAEKFAVSKSVGIICGPQGYEKSYKLQEKGLNSNIKIYRVEIPPLDKNKVSLRIIRLLLLTLRMTFAIIKNVKKDDQILLVTNPAFLMITVALLKPFKQFSLDILVHDVFPENLVPAGLIKKESLKFKILSSIFNWSYRKSDKLIVLGEDMGELLIEKLRIVPERVQVIPNWFDPSIKPLLNYSASKYYNIDLSDKIIISFAGNIGRVQGLPEFIDCFIAAKNNQLALILVGDGALKEEIKNRIDQEKIENIFLIGSKPRSEQLDFLNACDISLITLKEGMKGLGVPSKTYNIMAAEKPILYIGDKNSEIDKYINNFDNGWSFSWEEQIQLINFLKNLSSNDFEMFKIKGKRSLEQAHKEFGKEQILSKFLNL